MTTSEVCAQYARSPGTQCLPQLRCRTPRQSFETSETCRNTSQSRRHLLFPDRGQIFYPTKPNVCICRRPSTAPVPTLRAYDDRASYDQHPTPRDELYARSQTPGATHRPAEHTNAVHIFPRTHIVNGNPQPPIPTSASQQLEICRSLQTPEICYVSNISNYVCYKTGNVRRNSKPSDTICHLFQTSVTECGSCYATICRTSQQSCTICTSPYRGSVVTPTLVHHSVCRPKRYARNVSTEAITGKYSKPHESVMAKEPGVFPYSASSMIFNAPPQISDPLFCYPSSSCLYPRKNNVYFTPLVRTSFSHFSLNKQCRSSHSFCRNLHHRENPFVYSIPSSTNCRRVRFSDSICRHSLYENSCSNSNVCRSSKSFHTCHPVCSSHSGLSSHTSVTSHSSHSNASCPSRISNIVCRTTEQREHTLRPYHTMFRQQKKSTVQFQQSQQDDGQIISTLISDDDGGCYDDTCEAVQNNVNTFQSDGPPGYTSRPQRNVGTKICSPSCPGKVFQASQPPCFNYRPLQPYGNSRTLNMPPNISTPNQITGKKILPFASSQRKKNFNKITCNMPQPLRVPDKVAYCTRASDTTYPSQEGGNMSPTFQNNTETSVLCPTFQNQAIVNRPLPSENPTPPPQTLQQNRRRMQVSGRIITSQQGKVVRATQVPCNTCNPCKISNMQSMQSIPSGNTLQPNLSGGISVQIQTLPPNVPGEGSVYCGKICPARSFGKVPSQPSPSANVNYPSLPAPTSRSQSSEPSYVSSGMSNATIQSSKIYCPSSSEKIICQCASGGNINCDCQCQFSGDKACKCTPTAAGNIGGNLTPLTTTGQSPISNNYYTDNAGNTSRYFELPEKNCHCPSKISDNMTSEMSNIISSEMIDNIIPEITDNMTSNITVNNTCDCQSLFSGDKCCRCPLATRQLAPSGILNNNSQNTGNINRHIEFSEPAANTVNVTSNISGDKSCNCPSSRIGGDVGVNVLPSVRTNRQVSPSSYQMQQTGNINQNVDRPESPQRNICHCSQSITGTVSKFTDNAAEPYLYGDKTCNCPSRTAGNKGTNLSPSTNYSDNAENISQFIEQPESSENRICHCKPQINDSYHSQNSDINRNIVNPVSSEKILLNSSSQTSGNIICECKSQVSSVSSPGRTNRMLQPSDNANYQSQPPAKECRAKSRHVVPCRNIGRRSPTAGNISRPVSPSGNVVQYTAQSINMNQPSQLPQAFQPPQIPQACPPPQIPQAFQPPQIPQTFQHPTNIRACQTSDIPCNPQCPRKACAPLVTSEASQPSRVTVSPGQSMQSGTFYQPQSSDTRACSCLSPTSSNTSCECSNLGDDNVSPQANSIVSNKVSPAVKFISTSPATIKITPSPTVCQNFESFGNDSRSSSPSRRLTNSGSLRHTSKRPCDTYMPAQGSGKTIYPIEPAERSCTPNDCEGAERSRNRGKNYQRQSSRERSRSPQSYENAFDSTEGMTRPSSNTQSPGILKRSSRPSSRRTRSPQPSDLTGNICPKMTGNICPSEQSGSIGLSQLPANGGLSQIPSTNSRSELFENASQQSLTSEYVDGTQNSAIIPFSGTSNSTFPSQYSGEDVGSRRSRGVCPSKRLGNNVYRLQRSGNSTGPTERSVVCPSQRPANIICPSQRSSKTMCPSQQKNNKPCSTCKDQCPGKTVLPLQFTSKSPCPPECSATGNPSSQQSQSAICPSKYSDYIICSSDNSDLLVCTSENSGYSFHNSDDTSSQPTQSNYSMRRRHRGESPKRSPSFRCSTILNRANISSKISISVKKTKLNRNSQPAGARKNSSKSCISSPQPSQESTRNSSKPNVSQNKNAVCYPILLSGIPHRNMHPSNNDLAYSPFANSISNHSQPPLGRVYSPTDTSEIIRPFSQPCGKTVHPFIFSGRNARPISQDSDILHSFPRSVSSPPSRLGSTESYRVSDNLHLVSDPSCNFRDPSTICSSFSNRSITSFLSPDNVDEVFRSASYHPPRTCSRSLLFVFSPLKDPDPPVSAQEESQSSDKRSSSA